MSRTGQLRTVGSVVTGKGRHLLFSSSSLLGLSLLQLSGRVWPRIVQSATMPHRLGVPAAASSSCLQLTVYTSVPCIRGLSRLDMSHVYTPIPIKRPPCQTGGCPGNSGFGSSLAETLPLCRCRCPDHRIAPPNNDCIIVGH